MILKFISIMRILAYLITIVSILILAYEKVWWVLIVYFCFLLALLILEKLNYKNTNDFIIKYNREY